MCLDVPVNPGGVVYFQNTLAVSVQMCFTVPMSKEQTRKAHLAEAKALAKKKGVSLSYAIDLLAAQRREARDQK